MENVSEKMVKVLYKYIDGAHVFIGGDEMSDGLCVAVSDIHGAYEEVAAQLTVLAKENFGEEAHFVPQTPVEDFISWVKGSAQPPTNSGILPLPQAFVIWGSQQGLAMA